MEVILAHEKHGVSVWGSAIGLLARRIAEGWYDDIEPKLRQSGDRLTDQKVAQRISDSNDESHAWCFLANRYDYEYEGVEKVKVLYS